MSQNKGKKNWSEGHWKETLIEQRKFMWFDDTVSKFAAWLDLKPGMVAVDVGCGLGYLGFTYWSYFGKGGRYVGVDTSAKLLQEATEAATQWATDGETHFLVGDAYKLPISDNYADLVMCQTLLMHMKEPKQALSEMIRIAKPGGLIMCKEPDNVSSMLARGCSSISELDIDDELLSAKIILIGNKGRMKLGLGDYNIGSKVPHMMKLLGLVDIGIRLNDRVYFLEPPYESPLQQHQLAMVKKNTLDDKAYNFWLDEQEEWFLAGGGDPKEFNYLKELSEKIRSHYPQQFELGEFFCCRAHLFYIIKGKKTK